MNTGTVVFIDTVHPVLWERLSAMGWTCIDKTALSKEEAEKEATQHEGVVIRSKFKFTDSIFKECKQLKFIARAGSGLENIDLKSAEAHNVKVFSSPEGNRDAVAEHVVGSILMLLNHLKRADKEVRDGIWKRAENRGFELKNQTLGLIGYGVMGKAVAERFSGFGMKILATDLHKTGLSDNYVQEVTLAEIQEKANIVSLHMNYLNQNKYFIDQAFIQQMKNPFYLINSARGFNVKTEDLVEGLKSNKVLGACLDVLEYESVSFETVPDQDTSEALQYLTSSERVTLSPHIAGWTHESHFKLSNVLADKIKAWMA